MSVRVERRLGWITVNGQRYPEEKSADWLTAVERGLCPFCGEGPFVVVAAHVSKIHGIDRKALRDMLGVTFKTSICDPTHAAMCAAISRQAYETGRTGITHDGGKGRKRRLSWAARQLNAEKARGQTPEQRRRSAEGNSRTRRERTEQRDAEIAGLLRGTDLTFSAVASQIGVHSRTVRAVADRLGIEVDGQRRYHESRRGKDNPALAAQRELRNAKIAERRQRLLDEYAAGASVEHLAEAENISVRQMRAYLNKYGAGVPPRPRRSAPQSTILCPVCGKNFQITTAVLARRRKASPHGPFCSRSCGAKDRVRRIGTPTHPKENAGNWSEEEFEAEMIRQTELIESGALDGEFLDPHAGGVHEGPLS